METLPISDGMIEKKYDRKVIVISTLNISNSSHVNFTMRLPSPLRDVVAIKLLGFEVRPPGGNSFLADEIFLNINDFHVMTVPYNQNGEQYQRDVFANFFMDGSGITFSNVDLATTLSLDPYTYIFDPIKSSLDRFDVKVTDNNGNFINTLDQPVKLVVAVYTKRNKFSRV